MTIDFSATSATIAGFVAELTTVVVDAVAVPLWRVADLERHVDRAALLADAGAPEPPYWAHLWAGAVVLADALPAQMGGRVLELGCGLGLPGLVAARRGARVTLVDRVPEALAFAQASARSNGVPAVQLLAADLTTLALRRGFDLVLAAEVLYDRAAFAALAATIRRTLAPGGQALLADAGRIDTGAFYDELEAAGCAWQATAHVVREQGLPVTVRVVKINRSFDREGSPAVLRRQAEGWRP